MVDYRSYSWADGVFTYEGSVSIEHRESLIRGEDYAAPWRIPFDRRLLYPGIGDGDEPLASRCAGIRLTFCTNDCLPILELRDVAAGERLDLWVNGVYSTTLLLKEGTREAPLDCPGSGMRRIEVWPDQSHGLRVRGIAVRKSCRIEKARPQGKRWVHYGSSISQAQNAGSPSLVWASRAAIERRLHLTNLGFSGSCALDPMIGRLLRDLPADVITMALGINTHKGVFSARSFPAAAIGLVQLIREKHPNTPLFIISPIISPPRESARAFECSLTLQEMRAALENVAQTFQKYGDRHLHYIDGRRIFGEDEVCYLPDLLHPSEEGQPVLAAHFIREIFDKLPAAFFAADGGQSV